MLINNLFIEDKSLNVKDFESLAAAESSRWQVPTLRVTDTVQGYGRIPVVCQIPSKNGSDNPAHRATSAKPFQVFERLPSFRASTACRLACQSRRLIRLIAVTSGIASACVFFRKCYMEIQARVL